ncbi:MAG TPA: DUF6055 domain-containing protein, partial [Verrucomicrobiae bacterium]|nr:DUF6055 domain-containing protein [Verrucomicrobiae bacterium]
RVMNGKNLVFTWKSVALVAILLAVGGIHSQAATELRAELASGRMILRWSAAPDSDWTLEEATVLSAAGAWTQVNALTVAAGDQRSVTLPLPAPARFYRLRSNVAAPTAPSAELIDQAVTNGTISSETGTLYKVYALFNDSRLPGQYKGNDTAVTESDALDQALEQWESFSDATRASIYPFFIPPAYKGSGRNPATGGQGLQAQSEERPELDPNWAAVPVSGGNVKVWYDIRDANGHSNAVLYANVLNNQIWPAITGLGILAPLSDINTGDFDGGDGRLDVYLDDLATPGVVTPHGLTRAVSSGLKKMPVFLRIDKTQPQDELIATLAHEFMHACQWAYPVKAASLDSYKWLKESTAQWAIDFVYPSNQLEHRKAKAYVDQPRLSLDTWGKTPAEQNHGYGSYLFFQYLSRSGGASLIKDIWAGTTNYSEQLEAVDKSIPGGFKEQWPKFAKTLWNQDPIVAKPASFKSWDSMAEIPGTRFGVADLPAGAAEDTITLQSDQPNLTSTYYHFTFSTAETRSMMFHNTFFENRKSGENISVQAMWKNAAGAWTEEDWTTNEWVGFCRDQKDQRLSDLIIIVSSAKWESPGSPITAAEAPEFKRNNIGCWGYQGTASRTTRDPDGGIGETTVSATVRYGFRAAQQYSNPAEGRIRAFLMAPIFADGGLEFNERYTAGDCTYSASGSYEMRSVVSGGDSASSIVINNFTEALPPDLRSEQQRLLGPDERSYIGNGETLRLVTGQVTGQDCDPTYITAPALWMLTNLEDFEDGGIAPKVRPDGKLAGSLNDPDSKTVYRWDLTPVQEP